MDRVLVKIHDDEITCERLMEAISILKKKGARLIIGDNGATVVDKRGRTIGTVELNA